MKRTVDVEQQISSFMIKRRKRRKRSNQFHQNKEWDQKLLTNLSRIKKLLRNDKNPFPGRIELLKLKCVLEKLRLYGLGRSIHCRERNSSRIFTKSQQDKKVEI